MQTVDTVIGALLSLAIMLAIIAAVHRESGPTNAYSRTATPRLFKTWSLWVLSVLAR